jgi:hypothetical protein
VHSSTAIWFGEIKLYRTIVLYSQKKIKGHTKQCIAFVKNARKKIKDKSNNDKITFYIFKTLNIQFLKENFHNNNLLN